VITGATKDSCQPTAWENHNDNEVPSASRRMRTLAMDNRRDSGNVSRGSIGIGEQADEPHLDLAEGVEQEAVTGVYDDGGLSAYPNTQALTRTW